MSNLRLAAVACAITLLADAGDAWGGDDSLTLRVNDAIAGPGGVAAIVLRTYASRGIGQGQICFAARDAGAPIGSNVLGELLRTNVFSVNGDVSHQATLLDDTVTLEFSSASGTVNSIDGPLAVFYFRIASDVPPDARFDIEPDLANTFLVDAFGADVVLDLRPGGLDIRSPGDPFQLEAAAEPTLPGQTALISMQTAELRLLSSGQVALRYDPAIAAGLPQVRIDPRYGNASFTLSGSMPANGLVLVSFESPTGTLNRVTGDVISLFLPTRPGIPLGTVSPVTIDPALTFLVNRQGQVLPLELEPGLLEFR